MPNLDNTSRASLQAMPDYKQLVQFLLEPLLDAPESLRVDCEPVNSGEKVWVRVAFEQEDKGKVFGRGGRNLRAIEVLLNTSAIGLNQQIHLDVFGHVEADAGSARDRSSFSRGNGDSVRRTRTSASRQPRSPKPAPQLRSSEGNS